MQQFVRHRLSAGTWWLVEDRVGWEREPITDTRWRLERQLAAGEWTAVTVPGAGDEGSTGAYPPVAAR